MPDPIFPGGAWVGCVRMVDRAWTVGSLQALGELIRLKPVAFMGAYDR
jgi:hypothetical protein